MTEREQDEYAAACYRWGMATARADHARRTATSALARWRAEREIRRLREQGPR